MGRATADREVVEVPFGHGTMVIDASDLSEAEARQMVPPDAPRKRRSEIFLGDLTILFDVRASEWDSQSDLVFALRAVSEVFSGLEAKELSVVSERLTHLLHEAAGNSGDVDPITKRPTRSPSERAGVGLTGLMRRFDRRRELLADALSPTEVTNLLDVARPTPRNRVAANSLLGVLDGGALRYPAWQFDPDGPDGVIAGLPDVLKALGDRSPFSKLSWLTRMNPYLDDQTPVDALRSGEIERVVEEAEGLRGS